MFIALAYEHYVHQDFESDYYYNTGIDHYLKGNFGKTSYPGYSASKHTDLMYTNTSS